MIQHGLDIFLRLGMARQDQPTPIHHRNPDFHHLDGRQLFQYGCGRQSRRVNQQPILQGDLQAVSQEGNQHMRIRSMFQLVMNGPDAQFALQ